MKNVLKMLLCCTIILISISYYETNNVFGEKQTREQIKLLFNDYQSIKYYQKNQKKFIENLSIIDVIANLGWINTEAYVKQK